MSEPAQTAPTNLEAEDAVLGAVMVNRGQLNAVLAGGLRAEHFYRDSRRQMFAAVTHLAALGEPVETMTVAAELERRGQLEDAGGREAVSHCASTVPVAGNATHYAGLVIETAQLRAQLLGAQQVIQGVHQRDQDLIQRGIALTHADYRHEAEPVEPQELADEFFEFLHSDEPAVVWPTPWSRVNNLLGGGLYEGQVTLLIGWPGDGKTTVLDQVLAYLHESMQTRNLVLATEMDRRERLARFVSSSTGIPWKKVRTKDLSADQLESAGDALNTIPFGYRRVKGWSVEQICQEIAIRKPDVVALDSVHGLPYKGAGELRQASGQLQAIAATVGCHLIMVCQLNNLRADGNAKPAPVERDIRDSSALEYDATNILSLYRTRTKQGGRETTGFLQVLKARNGIDGHKMMVELIPGSYGFEPLKRKPKAEDDNGITDDTPIDQIAMIRPADS